VRTQRTLYRGAINEGMEKGMEQGIKKGMEKGMEKGRAEGREETIREMVLNAHRNGLSVVQIQAITGLSAEKIEEITHQFS
jgi:predicted transposase/invertase (TIGR01784 family)